MLDPRARFAERAIEQARDELQKPEVVDRLGGYAGRLLGYTEQLFIPNSRNDKLVLPKEYRDEDKIPVVALDRGKPIIIDFQVASPQQKQVMAESIEQLGPINRTAENLIQTISDGIARQVASQEPSERSFAIGFALATTFRSLYSYPIKGDPSYFRDTPQSDYRTFERPVLAVHHTPQSQKIAPGIVAHELTHVDQIVSRSFSPIPDDTETEQLSDELAAHHISAMILRQAYINGEITLDTINQRGWGLSLRVEYVREKFGGEAEPFHCTTALKEKLAEANLIGNLLKKPPT